MVYKLLIVKNRYTKKLKLSKYLDWFKVNTPIEITTEEISTDFDVTPFPVGNGAYEGYVCGPDLLPKLSAVVPQNKYNAVVFVYGNDFDKIRVNSTNFPSILYANTDLIQLIKLSDNGKVLNHELFHAFIAKANRLGANIADPMDTYFNNDDLSLKKESNRTIALGRLKAHWDKVVSLAPEVTTPPVLTPPTINQTAVIIRQPDQSKQTLGDIVCFRNSESLLLKTLEREVGVRIPKGKYQVRWTFSPKFQKYTYELKEMPSYRIHSGNFFSHSEGCILLGDSVQDINADGLKDVLNSTVSIKKFEDFFNRESFNLIIV